MGSHKNDTKAYRHKKILNTMGIIDCFVPKHEKKADDSGEKNPDMKKLTELLKVERGGSKECETAKFINSIHQSFKFTDEEALLTFLKSKVHIKSKKEVNKRKFRFE